MDLQAAIYVVSAASMSNGIGGVNSTAHLHGGAKVSLDGRGFLGLRWQETVNQSSGIKERIEHRQDWPFQSMPSLVRRSQSSATVLSEVTNTHGCINPAGGGACTVAVGNRYFPFVSQSVETANDLNAAALPALTTMTQYDNFGNATSIAVSTGDGYSKTTTNIYNNDVPNWLLGRLKSSTVQSTVPAP
jgi:hypothetical protein